MTEEKIHQLDRPDQDDKNEYWLKTTGELGHFELDSIRKQRAEEPQLPTLLVNSFQDIPTLVERPIRRQEPGARPCGSSQREAKHVSLISRSKQSRSANGSDERFGCRQWSGSRRIG